MDWCRWVDKQDSASPATRQRERLEADIAEFLARGGEIQRIPIGVGKRETGRKLTRKEVVDLQRSRRIVSRS